MSFKTDKRLALYLGESTEDKLFRNRIEVASDTLGVSISKLLRVDQLCARQRFGPTGEAAVTLSYEQYFRRNVERFTGMVEKPRPKLLHVVAVGEMPGISRKTTG